MGKQDVRSELERDSLSETPPLSLNYFPTQQCDIHRYMEVYTFFCSNHFTSNLWSNPRKIKQLLRLRYHQLIKNVLVEQFSTVFWQMYDILSNFESKIREKLKQHLRLSACRLIFFRKSRMVLTNRENVYILVYTVCCEQCILNHVSG